MIACIGIPSGVSLVLMEGTAWTRRDGGTSRVACSPVLAMTIQKISINYCSYYSFEGTFYVVKAIGHALGWRLKGRSGLATLLRVPVDIKRGTERRLWCGYKKYRSFQMHTTTLLTFLPSSKSLILPGSTSLIRPCTPPPYFNFQSTCFIVYSLTLCCFRHRDIVQSVN